MDRQDEQARERLAHQRQHDEHTQDTLLTRAEAEIHEGPTSVVEEKARQSMAKQLHEADHTQDTLLERSEEELH